MTSSDLNPPPIGTGDAPAGRALMELMDASYLMAPAELPDRIAAATRPLGVAAVRIYLADLQQHHLRAMRGGADRGPPVLAIDSTLAGRAFRTARVQRANDGRTVRLWVPLLDGTERLGVMELTLTREESERQPPGDIRPVLLERCRLLGSFAGLYVASRSGFSDAFAVVQRSHRMASQAELVWAFMPPRTFGTGRVLLAGALEPAYEVGGDALDHSLLGDHLHVAIVDSVGHDLTAGLISSVVMAACRAARRSGAGLPEIAEQADQALTGHFGASRFATALLCDLDTGTGRFTWLPCGHPPPLLFRGNKVVKELLREPRPPLGLAGEHWCDASPSVVHAEQLQPGDRLLLYTDGVVDGRDADGREFGLARLTDFVIRHSAEGLAAPETLRRLITAILAWQPEELRDDATVVLLEWLPRRPAGGL